MHATLSSFTPYIVEHDYAGVRLKVHIGDPLARGWYDRDWELLPEVDLLRAEGLAPGNRVFDLGAHQGVVAMILARQVGPDGQVIAVEALPHNARVCRINCDRNGLKQIRVEEAAVAESPGELEICIDLNAQVKHARTNIGTVRVPAITVDELTERYGPPNTLFIDVEGYECHVLRGSARTLEHRPCCFIEVHLDCGLELAGGSVSELFRHLSPAAYDYRIWTLENRSPVQIRSPGNCPLSRFFLVALPRGKRLVPSS